MEFFRCKKCGTIVGEIKFGGSHASCCGEEMEHLIPGTSDGSREKHVPVVEIKGNKVIVTVGSIKHPMQDVHYIEWIAIRTSTGVQRKTLKPGEEPIKEFSIFENEEVLEAYSYCNIHGLYKK